MAEKYIGQAIKRTEDPRLVSGLGHYVGDINLPDLHHVALVRSMHAHARIRQLDASRALPMPGVVGVFTGEDCKDVGSVPCASSLEGLKVPRHPVLALGKVHYLGEPIAAVVADSLYRAVDAAEALVVDYEPLPAVVDPEQAARAGSPLVHEEFSDNVAFVWSLAGGSVEQAFREADRVLKQRMVHQRLIPMAMEPRGVIARFQPGEQELTLWSSTQIPHLMRTQVAIMLGLAENRLRVIAPEVGGGFGSKLNVYGEEALLGLISMRLHKPVKWIETRRENFAGTIHGRGQVGDVEIAVKNDGRVTGVRYTVWADLGAYLQLLTPAIPTLTGLMLTGAYRIPSVRMDVKGVFTNKVATDAYRGAGRPEATYVVERVMDLVAQELNMDPVEVRRVNFPAKREFPFKTATGLVYDSGNYEAPLKRALRASGYSGWRRRQERERKKGRYLGIGVSTYVEICALGPSPAMPAGGWESATVRIEPTGRVTVLTGASPHGQGQETSFAQIAAEMLGVAMEDVLVLHGDTSIVQYGIGTFGSRATAVGGTAIYRAIEKLLKKATLLAAHLLEVPRKEVRFEAGRFVCRADPARSVSIQEVALASYTAKKLPAAFEPGLSATYFYEPSNFTFPFGAHICIVEVDRETGVIKILKYVAVDDCGRVINPLLVEGQVHGGIVQALGQAFMEEAVYDEIGQLVTGTLMDYAIPRAHDVPWMELDRTETRSPVNPLGVKGVGEAGTIGATPALVNAVVDALRPFAVRHIDMPLRPEKVWKLMRKEEQ
ncbi:MAG: xanthine dehydrogenase family protein molybdopterin-binding subunit [Acidobacteria bacterium]|nr:xanthine dehydrogenase family protein molybdopterin-binding subunit [Acidobacteriota bacterium]